MTLTVWIIVYLLCFPHALTICLFSDNAITLPWMPLTLLIEPSRLNSECFLIKLHMDPNSNLQTQAKPYFIYLKIIILFGVFIYLIWDLLKKFNLDLLFDISNFTKKCSAFCLIKIKGHLFISFQYTGGVSCLTFLPAAPPPVHLWVSCRVISWCHHSLTFRPLSSKSPGGGAVA